MGSDFLNSPMSFYKHCTVLPCIISIAKYMTVILNGDPRIKMLVFSLA